jgi:hypothetical protein
VVVVLGGSVVDVVVVGAVVVVVGAVSVVGAVVDVTGGCVVVGAARTNGIVVDVGNSAEPGSVETFCTLALAGVAVLDFAGSVVGVVVLGVPIGCVVVVLVTVVVGPKLAAVFSSVWSWMLSGSSSWWTVTPKATTARRTVVAQLHCSIRR